MRALWLLAGASLVASTAGAAPGPVPGSPWLDDFTVATEAPTAPAEAPLSAPLFLAQATPTEPDQVGGGRMAPKARKPKKKSGEAAADTTATPGSAAIPAALTGDRARNILRSLTLPGWGQATAGRKTAATVFGLVEAGIWASFTAFRIQEHLRTLTYVNTAQIYAGVDLDDRDEEFRRIVGSFPSSDDYNRLVVYRDAANIYMQPGREDPVAYREYIANHELKGPDTWAWASQESYERYQDERKFSQRAGQRANTALAVAMANRLLSAIHAARISKAPAAEPRSWNLECVPVGGGDPTAFHLGVRTRF